MEGTDCVSTRPEMAEELPRRKSKIREIRINPLDNGFTVNVGCQSFAVLTKESLIEKLVAYIQNPDEVERKYQKEGIY